MYPTMFSAGVYDRHCWWMPTCLSDNFPPPNHLPVSVTLPRCWWGWRRMSGWGMSGKTSGRRWTFCTTPFCSDSVHLLPGCWTICTWKTCPCEERNSQFPDSRITWIIVSCENGEHLLTYSHPKATSQELLSAMLPHNQNQNISSLVTSSTAFT